jgi:hypothetical protein
LYGALELWKISESFQIYLNIKEIDGNGKIVPRDEICFSFSCSAPIMVWSGDGALPAAPAS